MAQQCCNKWTADYKIRKTATIIFLRSVMIAKLPTATIAHAIQLAVAPVLLLTGVASICQY
jgi:hypothetical protein